MVRPKPDQPDRLLRPCIASIPGPVKGDVDLHEPASVGTLGPVSVDAGVQEHVSIPGSVSVDVPGPVNVDIPAVNVELPMIEFNGNSGIIIISLHQPT